MTIINTDLRTDCQIFNRTDFCKYSRQSFVFLTGQRIVVHPFNRIQACSRPSTVIGGCKRTIRFIRIPIRQHEATSRNRSVQTILAIIGLCILFVSHHRVGSNLQPAISFSLYIGTQVVTPEGRTLRRTVLVVIAT